MSLDEIKSELNEIVSKLEGDAELNDEEINELEARANALKEEKAQKIKEAEERQATLAKVINLPANEEIEERTEVKKMEENVIYRNAFLKTLQGVALNEEEKRAYALSGVSGVIPKEISDNIISKITALCPILSEIDLLHVEGNVSYGVEGTTNAAAIHTENATINADGDTMVTVNLGGFEVTKKVQISKSVMKMSVNAFQTWLENKIAEAISIKLEDLVFNGTGTSQPKGILKESLTETKYTTAPTAANVRTWIGTLPAGYDNGAKIAMSKKTLFTQFMELQDNAKNALVVKEGNTYYVYGYPVMVTDKVADGVALLGNFKKYAGNLAEDVNVTGAFDIDTNSFKYLGCAIFDGKTALTEAFVVLKANA